MTTDIKTDLFRFATVRPPQLPAEEERNKHFVFHPKLTESPFYSSLTIDPGWNKIEKAAYLKSQAAIFSNITTINGVRNINPSLFVFADWLARNRGKQFTHGFIKDKITSVDSLQYSDKLTIWDNVFYQTIIKQSPEVLQALLQLLVADRFVKNYPGINDENLYPDFTILANAKVVIPEILVAYKPKSYVPLNSAYNSTEAMRNQEALENRHNLIRYKKAADELATLSLAYNAENAKAWQTAYNTHQQEVKEAFENATPQTNPDTGETYYPDAEIPEFKFNPVKPLTESYLKGRVSEDTAELVLDQLHLEKHDTLGNAINALHGYISSLSQKQAAVFEPSQKVMVVEGNIIEQPSMQRPAGDFAELYSYKLCSQYNSSTKKYTVFLEMNAGYAGAVCSSINMTVLCNGNTFTDDSFNTVSGEAQPTNVKLLIFKNTGLEDPRRGPLRINGTVSFNNGNTVEIISTVYPDSCTASVGKQRDTGADTGGNTVTENSTIGIWQLGVGDYRKVQQELCCYLPGEVSHIENVLKGEYKEKASRRLSRSETTTEITYETEKESLSDVSSTERNEMQSEVSKVLAQDRSFNVNVNAGVSSSMGFLGLANASASFNVNTGYASNTSQSDSTSQAVSYAKDVTERAMERVVQKVSSRRTQKMTDEYEETIKHGYDNRGEGAQNISGIYRWIDKEFKNQVVNYGKRLLYEMMIPEPARFFTQNSQVQVLQKPADINMYINGVADIDRSNYDALAAMYGAEVEPPPPFTVSVGKSFSTEVAIPEEGDPGIHHKAEAVNLKLPEGYYTVSAKAQVGGMPVNNPSWSKSFGISVGNLVYNLTPQTNTDYIGYCRDITFEVPIEKFTDEIPVGVYVCSYHASQSSVTVNLQLLDGYYQKWRLQAYNTIMAAYEQKMLAYQQQLAQAISATTSVAGIELSQKRSIEINELKKNCLTLLLKAFGYSTGEKTIDANGNISIDRVYENHAAKVRFFEAAFEWQLMSYEFFPYFWADTAAWRNIANQQDGDPLFRAFLQAGMARVLLSIRPGFEEAVLYFLETGEINLGKDLAIENELYLSLLAELLPVATAPDGDPWQTRLPTTLVLLQKDNVRVSENKLPCACAEEGEDTGFETYEAGLKPVLPE